MVYPVILIIATLWSQSTPKPSSTPPPQAHPLTAEKQAELNKQLDDTIAHWDARLARTPDDVGSLSARGTALFHRGRFREAVADFDRMVALDPGQEASHWRRGIALYYTKDFTASARQFQVYHTFDNVDRENGIWRFLAQAQLWGVDKARVEMLKYQRDDRPPFADIYALFAGTQSAEGLLENIRRGEISADEKEKQYFYAHLYLGLWFVTQKAPDRAKEHLRAAVANRWGQQASGGPGYMWHVGRLHYDLLLAERAKVAPPMPKTSAPK